MSTSQHFAGGPSRTQTNYYKTEIAEYHLPLE